MTTEKKKKKEEEQRQKQTHQPMFDVCLFLDRNRSFHIVAPFLDST
jgi:hypothetical protein